MTHMKHMTSVELMELLEEKQILHFLLSAEGADVSRPPLCTSVWAAGGHCDFLLLLRLLVCNRHRVWWMTSGFAYHSALCCYTQSLTPHTQHLQTLRTALWSGVCRGRFRTIFKVMTRPPCFHGFHFSSVAPWRSLSSKNALSRLTDTSFQLSAECILPPTFEP